jgi:2-alkyl-3-oxoalkanoate reductase
VAERPRPVAVLTGASGFLGRAFRIELRARGWAVRGVDVRPGPDVAVGDISRPGAWTSVLEGADLLVHCGAVDDETGDAATFWRINVEGTRTVLTEAARAGVRRVGHLSSTVVHGRAFPDGVDEAGAVRMTGNPYTDTMVAAEHQALMLHAAGDVAVTVLRPGEVYGPHSRRWTVRPVELLRRNMFTLVDGGKGVLSPVYVDDVVSGTLAATDAEQGLGQVFHLTGGEGITAREFFGHYADALGKPLRSLPSAAAAALSAPVDLVSRSLGWQPPFAHRALEYVTHPGAYSIAKAKDVLGWAPQVSLDEGMRRTLLWLEETGLVPPARGRDEEDQDTEAPPELAEDAGATAGGDEM